MHDCLLKPTRSRKSREKLQQKGCTHDDKSVADRRAQDAVRQRRVWRLVVGSPGKRLLPFFLGNVSRPDSFQRQPRSVGQNASFARNRASQPEGIRAPDKINAGSEHETHKRQNEQTREIDIGNHETGGEPRSREGFHIENRRNGLDARVDERVQEIEDVSKKGFVVGGLQERDQDNHKSKLHERKSEDAPDWSSEKLDHAHGWLLHLPPQGRNALAARMRPILSLSG